MKSYNELVKLPSFEERFRYLRLNGNVGSETFGFDRWLNQQFYRSQAWKQVRDRVIVRDGGCDLGVSGREIAGRVIVHHMNPVCMQDILEHSDMLLNEDYLVCVSHDTHNAIHYGDESLLPAMPKERSLFDTCPWKRAANIDDNERGEQGFGAGKYSGQREKAVRAWRGL